jgi:hypothetical protein
MATVALGTKAVGSKVQLKLGGVKKNFIIVHKGKPSSLYDDSCNGVWLLQEDIQETRQWQSTNVNKLESSEIQAYLNSTYLALFDANIQAQIKQVKIPYRQNGGSGGTDRSGANGLSCKIFLLSAKEVGFSDTYIPNDGAKLDYFNSGNGTDTKRVAKYNGSATYWWLRSPRTVNTDFVWDVDSDGQYSGSFAITTYGVRPALVLPTDLLVSDDGTVTTNTAPTTPGSITVPESIQGGSTITVSWTASTDAQNNLEGYVVERSTNGGTSWSQIYQGSALSATNTVPAGTQTVMYRVKAYDSDGLSSGYKTSGQITVINNTAPSAPASITVPNTVYGGQSNIVTWGAATDPDGDAVTYALERQIDGGDWSQIYTGSALSYTDTVTRGWTSVAYRVKAVDSRSASGPYATSPTRTVNNNLAPTVTCSQASGTNLGTKNTGFSIDYSVSDPDGDTVTVKEAIDGEVKRTFTATPGTTYTFQVTGETFMKVLNGDHTLTITANDTKMDTVHKLLFKKEITAAMITLTEPVEADAKIAVCVLSVNGSIPADANFEVKVTNNGKDAAPVWEDCTNAVKTGANHVFTNSTQTNGWAFNFKVTVSRGASGQGGYINSVQGGFQ